MIIYSHFFHFVILDTRVGLRRESDTVASDPRELRYSGSNVSAKASATMSTRPFAPLRMSEPWRMDGDIRSSRIPLTIKGWPLGF